MSPSVPPAISLADVNSHFPGLYHINGMPHRETGRMGVVLSPCSGIRYIGGGDI